MKGTIDVPFTPKFHDRVGGPCTASSDYSEISAGSQIEVKNAAGAIVGAGRLGAGHLTGTNFIEGKCRFAFTVTDVPATSKFYTFAMGQHGSDSYTLAQIKSGVHLVLGG